MTSRNMITEERIFNAANGIAMLALNVLLMLAGIALIVWGFMNLNYIQGVHIAAIVIGFIYTCLIGPILFCGLKSIKPGEGLVLTLFGRYLGTLKEAGFYFVHPFAVGVNPAYQTSPTTGEIAIPVKIQGNNFHIQSKKVSLKYMTLNNEKQKINDKLGNPVIIGIVVIWRVVNTAKAVFNVDNFVEFLSIQCDSALRNIVRLYPYDPGDTEWESLRNSSAEISEYLCNEIQQKVEIAGLEISEARITHLAYAPEIAAAMLQRQQASAIVDARQMIVDGAVGMVEMALARISENNVVELDEERKAAMVSNLLVVLCGNRDAQPIVNSGSLY